MCNASRFILIAAVFSTGLVSSVDAMAFGRRSPRAESLEVRWSASGMPEALILHRDSGNHWEFALEFAAQDRYQREITAVRRRFPWADRRAVSSKDSNFLGQPLSEKLRRALSQIERGGLEYRATDSASEILAQTPIRDFDLRTGRELATRFGVGFAGDLYSAWLARSQSRGEELTDRILSGPGALAGSRDWLFIVVPGFSVGDPDLPEEEQPAVEAKVIASLRSLGRRAEGVATARFGGIAENSNVVELRLRQRLLDGERIVLIAMSRGMAESSLALSRIGEYPDLGAHGAVEAVVSLSGLYQGSFVADWASQNPGMILLAGLLKWFGPIVGDRADSLAAAAALARDRVSPLVEDALRSVAATGPVPTWITFSAVPEGNGLGGDPGVRVFQDRIIRPWIGEYGTNDGLIEHPDSRLPARVASKVASRSRDFSVRSSHSLWDGRAGEFVLGTPAGMSGWVGGWIQLIEDTDWR